ncbi:hypothetical protein [Embleya sp. NBC_00896]|uniref:hypothetical protein n=1 Tax=Embleya sp. NBC_00896 TaxID=2975961 RepID=UPI002F911DCE|nr:hypothetical protein OG928_45315 [Embleya sp. NBC_00896]
MSWDFVIVGEQSEGVPEIGFNMSSMGPVKRAMDGMGMLTHGLEAPFPDLEDFGVTWHQACAVPRDRMTTAALAFRAAYDAALDWAAEEPTGIAEYKIGHGNDNWLVTPKEIRAALTTLATRPSSAGAEARAATPRWDELIDFLRRAKEHGGFRVE